MNAVILTPGRTVTTTHPVFHATDDKLGNMFLIMFIGRYLCMAYTVPGVDKQMRVFPERNLPWLKMGRIRCSTFHTAYCSTRTSPRISPASFIACVRVQSIKRDGL